MIICRKCKTGFKKGKNMTEEKSDLDSGKRDGVDVQSIIDHIENCPVVFRSQQIGDPELTRNDKRQIAENMLINKPINFLSKFGKYLKKRHLNYILSKNEDSYEVKFYVDSFKRSFGERNKNRLKRNRRYEAMKRMEANGSYFSDAEMEKREPLLYHQMVGQYLNEREKQEKYREACEKIFPTFSNFLLDKLEKEELNDLRIMQEKEENKFEVAESSISELENESVTEIKHNKKWGLDWEEEKEINRVKVEKRKIPNFSVELKEKALLYEEFKSTMQNKFLNGQDKDFNYSDVDSNSDYDCLELREQDEEEKYFDEETCDHTYTSTDTGIDDY